MQKYKIVVSVTGLFFWECQIRFLWSWLNSIHHLRLLYWVLFQLFSWPCGTSCPNPTLCHWANQHHAQHPLKTTEWMVVLNSWYQIDMSLYSNRYLFVGSKISGQKWQPWILHKTMLFFASWVMPLVHLVTTCPPAQKATHAHTMDILWEKFQWILSLYETN